MNREKNMFSRNQKALAFVTGALLSLQSFAADLTEVSFTALSAEELQAVLTFDGEAPAASGYLMESPARLVVDLPDTVNAVDQRRFSLSGSVATDAMLLSNSDKTRLVFNLTRQHGIAHYRDRGRSHIKRSSGVGCIPAFTSILFV